MQYTPHCGTVREDIGHEDHELGLWLTSLLHSYHAMSRLYFMTYLDCLYFTIVSRVS